MAILKHFDSFGGQIFQNESRFFWMNSLCGLKANGPFSSKSWPGTLWKLKFAILSLQITILKLKIGHFEAKIDSFETKTDHFEPKFAHFEAKMVHFEGLPSFRFPSYALAPQNPPGF